MAFEYLSDEQARRYGAFVADPSPEELERFFFLNAEALQLAPTKRRRHNRLGWAVQWGTVRMLGTFLEDPLDVPRVVVDYAAEQLGVDDPSCVKAYAERAQTRYEHAWEIRDLLGFRDFADEAEAEVTAFVASQVEMTRDSRRELFDRTVLWLIENRVLLPGPSTLSRLVTEVRRVQLEAALRALAKLMAARKPGAGHIRGFEGLVTGSWRRLVFASPKLEPPLIDRPAYVFCVMEALHGALRRRHVYAVGADKWGDPRARLIEPRLWVRERSTVLTALDE